MAKRLSAAERVGRLVSEGWSRSQIGKAIGRSVATVGRILRGESKGEKALPALREFSKAGKASKAAIVEGKKSLGAKLPPAPKAKTKAKPARVSPIDRAAGQLAMMGKAGVEKVVVHVTSKETGRSRTLFAKGGVSVDTLRGASDLGGVIGGQMDAQGYSDDVDFDSYDWTIDFEEY